MKPNEIVQTRNYAAKMHGPEQAPSPGQQQWWWRWGMLSLSGSSLTCGEYPSPTASGNGSGECWVFQRRQQQTGRQHAAGSRAGSGCTQLDWTGGHPCRSISQGNLWVRSCLFKALGSTAGQNDEPGTCGDYAVWKAPAPPQLQARERMADLMLPPTALKKTIH